jgi:hypothetical protein
MHNTLKAFYTVKEGSREKYLITKNWLNIPSKRVVRPRFQRYKVGDTVMSRWTLSQRKWYPGVVVAVDLIKDVYQIKYDDGDMQTNVGRERLRKKTDEDEFGDVSRKDDDYLESLKFVDTVDKYDNDNKRKCNGWMVKASQQVLGGTDVRGLVIDACKLNTTRSLLEGGVLKSERDVVHVINFGVKEMEKMVVNFSDIQQKSPGHISLSSCLSTDFLRRCKSRDERLNFVFLDYCCTFKTMKRWGDLELLFKNGGLWQQSGGVFGMTLSLRGPDWEDQKEKIKKYVEDVVNEGGVMDCQSFSEESYGQMFFCSFLVTPKK